ncbi:recombinase family protein [Streptomyces sp. NPDC086787]|uniref:recombinase family protein n=1 Tax=Streptomyces sp. NPDC086787 TaxID=3365759 RepID=UPI003800E944
MPRLYGFDDASRRRLCDDEVGPLRQMVSRAIVGNQSNADIAVWANGEGYRGTLGGEWKDASVGRLFRNPAIAGLRYDDEGKLVEAGHPGAITPEEFSALQARESSRKTSDASPPYDYLLVDGASTCGKCTWPLQGARTNAGTPGLRCRPKDKDGRGGCGEVRIDAELLENYVGEYVVAELLKPGIRAQILKAQAAVAAKAEKMRAEISELESRKGEAATLYGQRQISSDAWVVADREITANLKEIGSRLRYAEQMAAFELGDAKNLVKWWNSAPSTSRKAIVRLLLEKVEVFPARARGVRTIEPGRVVLHWRKLPGLSGKG